MKKRIFVGNVSHKMKYLMVYNANVHLSIPEIVGLSSAKEY